MEEKLLFELDSVYRDNMRVRGYLFGEGEKSACIVGATRGNEVQQVYICSQLIKIFGQLEEQGKIRAGRSIMVIPTVNSYSMNIGKRFWPIDNTDINRMFPGYSLGETTQRIAAAVFDHISEYKYGIQFASFYMKGNFIPHVRMMKTGYEDTELAKDFGLPYVFRRDAKPYDTTTLNYNWQIWDTKAFSVYTNETDSIDIESAREAINAVLSFLNKNGIIEYRCHEGYISQLIEGDTLVNVKTDVAGIFIRYAKVNSRVQKGDVLAEMLDPYKGTVIESIKSPTNGIVFFHANQPIIYSQTTLFRIIPTDNLI
jgi:predicted deacylase